MPQAAGSIVLAFLPHLSSAGPLREFGCFAGSRYRKLGWGCLIRLT